MPKRIPYARISITLPKDDLAAADRLAREQDRPRSWLIAEAIRQYVANRPHASGLGESRRTQLVADLELTPIKRVRAAEETARVAFLRRSSAGSRVMAFDRYEDYLEWKRREETGG